MAPAAASLFPRQAQMRDFSAHFVRNSERGTLKRIPPSFLSPDVRKGRSGLAAAHNNFVAVGFCLSLSSLMRALAKKGESSQPGRSPLWRAFEARREREQISKAFTLSIDMLLEREQKVRNARHARPPFLFRVGKLPSFLGAEYSCNAGKPSFIPQGEEEGLSSLTDIQHAHVALFLAGEKLYAHIFRERESRALGLSLSRQAKGVCANVRRAGDKPLLV